MVDKVKTTLPDGSVTTEPVRTPQDDPKFYDTDAPLTDPSGAKGDVPENRDPPPGTITTDQLTGQSREILLPDGTKASTPVQQPGGGDAVPSWNTDTSTVQRAQANALPTEEEALQELREVPERTRVLSDKGWVTRDRLKRVTTTTESDSGIHELTVSTEKNGTVKVESTGT